MRIYWAILTVVIGSIGWFCHPRPAAATAPPEIALLEQDGQLVVLTSGSGLVSLQAVVDGRVVFVSRSSGGGTSQQRTALPLPPGAKWAQATVIDNSGLSATARFSVDVPLPPAPASLPTPAPLAALPGEVADCLPDTRISVPEIALPDALRPSEDTAVTVLLLGSDSRQESPAYGRTDTILLVRVVGREARLLSIPRDLWVIIPGYGQNRINAAYRLAELGNQNGAALLRETLAHNLGIEVDYYALLGFAGFEQIVDHLGGVDLCVPETVDAATFYGYHPTTYYPDEFYSYVPAEEGKGWAFLYIEPGLRHLDGQTALTYARSRASSHSDFDRVKRQQAVLLALRRQALQLGMVSKLPEMWETLSGMVRTDLSLTDALRLSWLLYGVNQVETMSMSEVTEGWTTPQGAQVLVPRQEELEALVARWRE